MQTSAVSRPVQCDKDTENWPRKCFNYLLIVQCNSQCFISLLIAVGVFGRLGISSGRPDREACRPILAEIGCTKGYVADATVEQIFELRGD
jgi:hypothetical protein